MILYEAFFRQATETDPYPYQVRVANEGLPLVMEAPPGSGKTATLTLGWLWQRLHGPEPDAVPRRLIYALPQRTLVEQVAGEIRGWLDRLGLTGTVALHVVMGGEGKTQHQWRLDMHQPAVVVGTVDSLVSKALNRGYGISRATYPIDFALVTNGAHWVIDEVQLAPESTTTLRQLAAFTQRFGTAEPFGLTCMSATIPHDLLDTVDNPAPDDSQIVRLGPEDRTGKLATVLEATRRVGRLDVGAGSASSVAAAVQARHRPGELTLVVVNTVRTAREIYRKLARTDADRLLLHSRYRAVERARLVERLTSPVGPAGRIVVATQVVEAGLDLDAAVLVTEAAPWPSIIQRAGRCNRRGRLDDAELWWLPPAKPAPYEAADVDATVAELTALAEASVTSDDLLSRTVPWTMPETSVIRSPDLLALFDTTTDLTGGDIDVSPYVRDADDLDVQVAWASWASPDRDGRPPNTAKAPTPEWRCRVPLGELPTLWKRGVNLWRFDQSAGRWTAVSSSAPARPGEVLVVAATDGGYDPEFGFEPQSKVAVAEHPQLVESGAAAAGAEDAYSQDDASQAQPGWVTLSQHSEETRAHAKVLVDRVDPKLSPEIWAAVVTAAYAHDAGKVHPTWQEALRRLAPLEEQAQRAGEVWAKSPYRGRLRYPGTDSFRHELVSLLLLDGPLSGLLTGVGDRDLVRYLVLAHHGKLRMQVRAPGETDEKVLLGLHDGDERTVDVLGHSGQLTVDLDQFTLGGHNSWTRTALELRDRYGPFKLAYLETLVRIADWRASAGVPLDDRTEKQVTP